MARNIKNLILMVSLCLSNALMAGGMEDDPLLYKVMIDQLEVRNTNGSDPFVWDAQAWVGKDLHKLWFKTEGERVDGETEETELQALYSRAIAPFWDFQVGWRREFQPGSNRDWLAIGFEGLAPYLFEVDAALFIGESGRTAARLEAEYEFLFTQRLILTPEVELNFHGKDDPGRGIGSGLSDTEAGLRLRYEIKREIAPYVGINWTKQFGDTADFARQAGEDVSDTQYLVGIRAWF
jgi:copper resistance protein B